MSASVVAKPSDSRSAPVRPLLGHAHGRQHVRRLHRAAGARRRRRRATARPGRAGTAAPRSRRPRCTRGPSPRPCAARGTVSCTPGDGGHAGRRPAGRAGAATRATIAGRSATVAAHGRAAMATMPATLCVPLRRSRSWPPPRMSGSSSTSPAHDEGADALGAAELVGADADAVGDGGARRRRRARRTPAPRRCAGRRAGARSRTSVGHRGEGLHGADLVVGQHDRHDRHVGVERVGQRVEVDAPGAVDADDASADVLDRVQHGVVLDGAAHRAPAVAAHRAEDGEVVGLGAAAGEHDLAGPAAEGVGHDVARLVHRLAGLAGGGVGRPTSWRSAPAGTAAIASTASGRIGVDAAWSR